MPRGRLAYQPYYLVVTWPLSGMCTSTRARNSSGSTVSVPAVDPRTYLFWEMGVFTNVGLLVVILYSVLLQIALHHIPLAQATLNVKPLSAADCALTMAVALVPVALIELSKVVRRQHPRPAR